MGSSVSEIIDNEVSYSKYFQSYWILDHNDQLSLIIRYITEDDSQLKDFCCFIIHTYIWYSKQNFSEAVLNSLELYGVKFDNCRSQSYDNSANMFGIY